MCILTLLNRKHQFLTCLGHKKNQETLKRMWRGMTTWQKTTFLFELVTGLMTRMTEEDIEEMLHKDMLEQLVDEFRIAYPSVVKAIVDERDMYLASSLMTCAERAQTVVAVVGAGHLAGIQKHWNTPIDRASLVDPPMPR